MFYSDAIDECCLLRLASRDSSPLLSIVSLADEPCHKLPSCASNGAHSANRILILILDTHGSGNNSWIYVYDRMALALNISPSPQSAPRHFVTRVIFGLQGARTFPCVGLICMCVSLWSSRTVRDLFEQTVCELQSFPRLLWFRIESSRKNGLYTSSESEDFFLARYLLNEARLFSELPLSLSLSLSVCLCYDFTSRCFGLLFVYVLGANNNTDKGMQWPLTQRVAHCCQFARR